MVAAGIRSCAPVHPHLHPHARIHSPTSPPARPPHQPTRPPTVPITCWRSVASSHASSVMYTMLRACSGRGAEGEVWVRDDGWAARRGRRLRLRLRRRARQHTCMISSPRACITTLRSYTPGARRELSSTDMCTWEI